VKPASTLSQLSSSAINRFTSFIRGVGRFVAAAAGPRYLEDKTAGVLLALACFHLDHVAKRFDRLITRLRNGTLESREPPLLTGSRQESGGPSYYLGSPLGCLPKGFGWLVLLAPEASCFADELRDMVEDPEVAEQLAAAPQIAKLFRPIGNMLGVQSDLIGSGPRGLSRRPEQEPNLVTRSLGPARSRDAACLPTSSPRRDKARSALLPGPVLLKNA
jgi:hypothetical protein